MQPAAIRIAAVAVSLALAGCGKDSPKVVPPSYGAVPPPATVPAVLLGDTWVEHYTSDVLPYWTMPEALGTPEGNFPTYRTMTGSLVASQTDRRPRMIARQVFAYVAGFLMTGDATLLGHARAGVDWLLDHARDPAGGWHPLLDAAGAPKDAGQVRTAQDAAYCGLGLAAWFFVTRDAAVEAEILALRDMLFDPALYWDAANSRIKDALTNDLGTEQDVDAPGWELVAQLDPINAFLLLTQPVLDDPARRDQFLADLRTLATTLTTRFYDAGIFWGVAQDHTAYRSSHVDFGHTLKAFWMILQIDKRLPDHPFYELATKDSRAALDRAYDATVGRWAKRPTSATTVEYGSDWWAYAECDQLASTLDLIDYAYVDRLASTTQGWLDYYVDSRPAREIVSSIQRNGSGYGWPDGDTAKCNEWKNGYHSSEHALVLHVLGTALSGAPVTLHFAVPPSMAATFVATPYVFQGTETARTPGATIDVGGTTLQVVDVTFTGLY